MFNPVYALNDRSFNISRHIYIAIYRSLYFTLVGYKLTYVTPILFAWLVFFIFENIFCKINITMESDPYDKYLFRILHTVSIKLIFFNSGMFL